MGVVSCKGKIPVTFTFVCVQECSAGYFPGASMGPFQFGPYQVEVNVERVSSTYTYRDFSITDTSVSVTLCNTWDFSDHAVLHSRLMPAMICH